MINFFAYVLISVGLFFVTIGVLGLIRFNNIFQRMHALSVMETLWVLLLFLRPDDFGWSIVIGS